MASSTITTAFPMAVRGGGLAIAVVLLLAAGTCQALDINAATESPYVLDPSAVGDFDTIRVTNMFSDCRVELCGPPGGTRKTVSRIELVGGISSCNITICRMAPTNGIGFDNSVELSSTLLFDSVTIGTRHSISFPGVVGFSTVIFRHCVVTNTYIANDGSAAAALRLYGNIDDFSSLVIEDSQFTVGPRNGDSFATSSLACVQLSIVRGHVSFIRSSCVARNQVRVVTGLDVASIELTGRLTVESSTAVLSSGGDGSAGINAFVRLSSVGGGVSAALSPSVHIRDVTYTMSDTGDHSVARSLVLVWGTALRLGNITVDGVTILASGDATKTESVTGLCVDFTDQVTLWGHVHVARCHAYVSQSRGLPLLRFAGTRAPTTSREPALFAGNVTLQDSSIVIPSQYVPRRTDDTHALLSIAAAVAGASRTNPSVEMGHLVVRNTTAELRRARISNKAEPESPVYGVLLRTVAAASVTIADCDILFVSSGQSKRGQSYPLALFPVYIDRLSTATNASGDLRIAGNRFRAGADGSFFDNAKSQLVTVRDSAVGSFSLTGNSFEASKIPFGVATIELAAGALGSGIVVADNFVNVSVGGGDSLGIDDRGIEVGVVGGGVLVVTGGIRAENNTFIVETDQSIKFNGLQLGELPAGSDLTPRGAGFISGIFDLSSWAPRPSASSPGAAANALSLSGNKFFGSGTTDFVALSALSARGCIVPRAPAAVNVTGNVVALTALPGSRLLLLSTVYADVTINTSAASVPSPTDGAATVLVRGNNVAVEPLNGAVFAAAGGVIVRTKLTDHLSALNSTLAVGPHGLVHSSANSVRLFNTARLGKYAVHPIALSLESNGLSPLSLNPVHFGPTSPPLGPPSVLLLSEYDQATSASSLGAAAIGTFLPQDAASTGGVALSVRAQFVVTGTGALVHAVGTVVSHTCGQDTGMEPEEIGGCTGLAIDVATPIVLTAGAIPGVVISGPTTSVAVSSEALAGAPLPDVVAVAVHGAPSVTLSPAAGTPQTLSADGSLSACVSSSPLRLSATALAGSATAVRWTGDAGAQAPSLMCNVFAQATVRSTVPGTEAAPLRSVGLDVTGVNATGAPNITMRDVVVVATAGVHTSTTALAVSPPSAQLPGPGPTASGPAFLLQMLQVALVVRRSGAASTAGCDAGAASLVTLAGGLGPVTAGVSMLPRATMAVTSSAVVVEASGLFVTPKPPTAFLRVQAATQGMPTGVVGGSQLRVTFHDVSVGGCDAASALVLLESNSATEALRPFEGALAPALATAVAALGTGHVSGTCVQSAQPVDQAVVATGSVTGVLGAVKGVPWAAEVRKDESVMASVVLSSEGAFVPSLPPVTVSGVNAAPHAQLLLKVRSCIPTPTLSLSPSSTPRISESAVLDSDSATASVAVSESPSLRPTDTPSFVPMPSPTRTKSRSPTHTASASASDADPSVSSTDGTASPSRSAGSESGSRSRSLSVVLPVPTCGFDAGSVSMVTEWQAADKSGEASNRELDANRVAATSVRLVLSVAEAFREKGAWSPLAVDRMSLRSSASGVTARGWLAARAAWEFTVTIANATLVLPPLPGLQLVSSETVTVLLGAGSFACNDGPSLRFEFDVKASEVSAIEDAKAATAAGTAATSAAAAIGSSSAAAADAQALALVSLVGCASPSSKEAVGPLQYLLSPLGTVMASAGDNAKEAAVLGNVILVAAFFFLHPGAAAAYRVYAMRTAGKAKDPKAALERATSWRNAFAQVRYPAGSVVISTFLVQGTAGSAFSLILGGTVSAVALLGVALSLALPVVTWRLAQLTAVSRFETDNDSIRYYRMTGTLKDWPAAHRPALRKLWACFVPVGRWGPPQAAKMFAAPFRPIRAVWAPSFGLVPSLQPLLLGMIAGMPVSPDSTTLCAIQLVSLGLVVLVMALVTAVVQPLRSKAEAVLPVASAIFVLMAFSASAHVAVTQGSGLAPPASAVRTLGAIALLQGIASLVTSLASGMVTFLSLTKWHADGRQIPFLERHGTWPDDESAALQARMCAEDAQVLFAGDADVEEMTAAVFTKKQRAEGIAEVKTLQTPLAPSAVREL